MIKECNVILRNKHIMVALYEGKEIQFPTDNSNKQTIYVKKQNEKYMIVDKLEEVKTTKKTKKRKNN